MSKKEQNPMYSTFAQTYSERILIPVLDSSRDCTVLSAPYVVTRAAARTGGDVNSRAHAEASELAFKFSSTKIMRKENMPTMDGLIDEKSFKEAVLAFSIWADGRAL